MKIQKWTAIIFMGSLWLSLASCGPAALSDEEFTEAAKPACQALATEIEALEDMDFAGRAAAYRQAAQALEAFKISEDSAPQGTLLRTTLAEMAGTVDAFSSALTVALDGADIENPTYMAFGEDGGVIATAGTLFDMVKLDVDPAVVLAMTDKLAALKEAATALGLEQCAPE